MKYLGFISLLAICIALYAVSFLGNNQVVLGSIDGEAGYQATTTCPTGCGGGFTGLGLVKTGGGMLGSVVVTGYNTGRFALYNATTSDVNRRTGNKATSTILIADFPLGTGTTTYPFDVNFTDGLLISGSGNLPTSTITYK